MRLSLQWSIVSLPWMTKVRRWLTQSSTTNQCEGHVEVTVPVELVGAEAGPMDEARAEVIWAPPAWATSARALTSLTVWLPPNCPELLEVLGGELLLLLPGRPGKGRD